MSVPPELARRYAPGEDIRPLVRAGLGSLIGVGLALALDAVIVEPGLPRLLWPAVLADRFGVAGAGPLPGVTLLVMLGLVGALAFVYGQFRRFVPGPAWHAGLAWAALVGALAVPALLPRAALWIGQVGAAPGSALLAAALVVTETGLGLAAYGAALGYLNPARR